MGKKNSEYKKIFEDNFLSDLQKYKKINELQNRGSKFWTIVIALNAVFLPFLFFTSNLEIDKPHSNPIIAFKNLGSS
tara:strand:- start:192 stop:422 length:231 start_codon:yes stop_codon:yes gene_type:complete